MVGNSKDIYSLPVNIIKSQVCVISGDLSSLMNGKGRFMDSVALDYPDFNIS